MNYFYGVQLLRILAAAAVVFSHIGLTFRLAHLHDPLFLSAPHLGTFGVIVFFSISGFIMSHLQSSADSSLRFMLARVIRVVPLYWAATIAWTIYTVAIEKRFEFDWFISSLFFVSQIAQQKLPYLYLGWSLEYEFLFYLVIGLTISIAKSFSMRIALSIGTVGFLAALGLGSGNFTYFAIGQIVYFCSERVRLKRSLNGLLLIPFFVAAAFVYEYSYTGPASAFATAMLAMGILACSVALNFQSASLSRLVKLGDSSYALYLLHPFVLLLLGFVSKRFALSGLSLTILGALVLTGAIWAATLAHMKAELPLQKKLKTLALT